MGFTAVGTAIKCRPVNTYLKLKKVVKPVLK
jgi:hypothetical protein